MRRACVHRTEQSIAPPGKGVIKVELVSKYSYWDDPEAYKTKKEQVTRQVIGLLERHLPGIGGQVEAADVVTLQTWERFMGGTKWFSNDPNKPFGISAMTKGGKTTLDGLDNFYMTGVWVSETGALPVNALAGKKLIKALCKKEGRKFIV